VARGRWAMTLSEEHYKQLVKFVNFQLDKAPFLIKDIARGKIKAMLDSPTADVIPADASFIQDYTVREVLEALRTAVKKGEI
jgi:hypothetical protein